MNINVIANSRSETAYIKNLEKITNDKEYNDFFKDTDFPTIPFVKVTYDKFRSIYLNVGFLSLLSGNDFVLNKLLDKFPDILNKDLIIESEKKKMKNYLLQDNEISRHTEKPLDIFTHHIISWNNLHRKIPGKLESLLKKELFSEKILFSLYRKNLIENQILSYLDNSISDSRDSNTIRFIYSKIVDFYFDNKLNINNNALFYKEFYLNNQINYAGHTQESYLKEKEKFFFFTNKKEQDFFEDKKIFLGFLNNFTSFYFEELFKEKNVTTYREGYDKKGILVKNIKNNNFYSFGAYDSHNLSSFFKNNHSVNLFECIENFFNEKDHPLNDSGIKEYYDSAFSIEKDDFSHFYLLLKEKHNYYLKPDMVNIDNLNNFKTVIENYKKVVESRDIQDIIYTQCKNYNYNFIHDIIFFNNINKQNIFEEFLRNAIILHRKNEPEHIIKIINDIFKNKEELNIDFSQINFKTTIRNQVSSLIEKELLNLIINNSEDHKLKKIKRL